MKSYLLVLASFVVLFSAGPALAASEVTNVQTGAGSVNESHIELEGEADLKIENCTSIKNAIKAESETGENVADKNTGGEAGGVAGEVVTGNANVDVSVTNDVNSNKLEVDTGGGDDGEGGGVSPGEEEFPPEEGGGVSPAEEEFALAEEAGGVAGAETLPEAGAEALVMALLASGLLTAAIRLKKLSLQSS